MVSIRDDKGVYTTMPYDFKDSLVQLMFHPNLGLKGKALLESNLIAEKLMKADNEILLEEEEYNKIKDAVDSFEGFTRSEVELVKRVTDCPEVNVKERK